MNALRDESDALACYREAARQPDLLVAPVRLPDVDPPAPHALDMARGEDAADYADEYAAEALADEMRAFRANRAREAVRFAALRGGR